MPVEVEIPCAMSYEAPEPYPEPRCQGKNRRFAMAMLSNMAGGGSEMSAAAGYLYAQLVTGRPEVAECFHRLAQVELRHLELFGALARSLGEDPRLWAPIQGRARYWTPGYLSYPRDLKGLLQVMLGEERSAIRKYEYQAGWIGDEGVSAVLRRVVQDERLHEQAVRQLYESYCARSGA